LTRQATTVPAACDTTAGPRVDVPPPLPDNDDNDREYRAVAPPLWLDDGVLAEEARDRHGLLTSPLAVFGCTPSYANEPVPSWVDDHVEVRRRLARKDDSGLGAETWQHVADIAVHCAELLWPRFPEVPVPRDVLGAGLRAATEAAAKLQLPPTAVVPGRPAPSGTEADTWWRTAGAIEAVAVQLCRAIDDPGWTDPDALAGWVTDARAALGDLQRSTQPDDPHSTTCSPGAACDLVRPPVTRRPKPEARIVVHRKPRRRVTHPDGR
jgi:hypothetical protein